MGDGQQHHQRLALPRELIRLLVMRGPGARILFLQRSAEKESELFALLLADDDEPPRRELAMVGNAHRDFEDLPQFVIGRPGADHLARASGSAGLEQR